MTISSFDKAPLALESWEEAGVKYLNRQDQGEKNQDKDDDRRFLEVYAIMRPVSCEMSGADLDKERSHARQPHPHLPALGFVAHPSGSSDSKNMGIGRRPGTLKNGLRVVIMKNTLAPVVTTQVNYLVGSNEAPAGFPGTAHALEHMMFRGSPGLTAAQLSSIAAAMGGEFNADTQQMVTQYFFTIPAEDLEIALRIEAIRMRGVLSTQKIWTLERGAIEQEVAQDLSNPQYVFYSRLLEAMYAGTSYAHDALGTRESFDRTTGAMLQNFHRAWYAPNNAILVIVGDVKPDQTLAVVKRLFEGIPRRPLPPRPGDFVQVTLGPSPQ